MLAFDLEYDTEALNSPQQNKSTLVRRLQQTQKSAFMPQTYTKSLFNVDNQEEYEQCNQKSNPNVVDKSVQKNRKGVSQRRRSKKKTTQLESLAQTNYTQIYENYAKIQKQPQFQQLLVQKSLMDLQIQSNLYETRRKAKRRLNKKIELQFKSYQKPHQVSYQHSQQINNNSEEKVNQIPDSPVQNCHQNEENTNTQLIETSSKVVDSCLQQENLFAALEQKSQLSIDTSNMKHLIQQSSHQIKHQEQIKDFDKLSRMRCLLVRDKDGFNCFWPQFHLYSSPKKKHIMSAKKTSTKPTSTFIISASKTNFQQNSQFYLGKMKSNIFGNVLNIFGKGLNPINAKEKNLTPRELIASIHYITDIFRGKPKQFQVFIKQEQYSYYSDFPQVKMYEDEIPLNQLYQFVQNKQKIKVYKNRKAYWSKSIGGYMLDFKGRAKIASSKNFILEQNQDGPETVLFGKLDDQNFNLDISQSIQPLVAFAVALSSFDSRVCD